MDCRIVDGADEFVGEGFESDGDFKNWLFRESEGRMWVDASQSDTPQPNKEGGAVSGEEQKVESTSAPAVNPRSYLDEQEEKMRKGQDKRDNARSKLESRKEQNKKQNKERNGSSAKERNLEINKAGKGFDKERFARPMGEGGAKPTLTQPPTEL